MIVSDIAPLQLRRQLRGAGVSVRIGPVVNRIRSCIDTVAEGIALHYADYPVVAASEFADFHVSVERPKGIRRWLGQQVVFRFDTEAPFAPLPGDQGFPVLEWGLNWCVSAHYHRYVILHAAVLERDGFALVLPAPSGSGKSTLCAGLMFNGWRLFSDELALIDRLSGEVVPLPRPVSLKNESIDVFRRFAPRAVVGPIVHQTSKGDVAHLRPLLDSVQRAGEQALPGWVILPQFVPDAPPRLQPVPKARAFMRLVESAFNYHIHGRTGFETLARLVDRCDCYEFSYHRLDEAVNQFARLPLPEAAAHS